MAINDGNVDVETCPEGLAKTLQPAKTALKNPLRDTEKSAPKSTQSSSNTPVSFPPPYYNFYPPYNHSTYPPYSPRPFPYHQQPHASLPQPVISITPPTAVQEPPSSSLPSKSNESITKLEKYINWLAKTNLNLTDEFNKCKEILLSNHIVLKTLFKVSDKLFEKWNISPGIKLLFMTERDNYDRAKAKGCV